MPPKQTTAAYRTPEQWLAYAGARLAPEIKDAALSEDRQRIAAWQAAGLSGAQIVKRLGGEGLAARSLESQWPTRDEVQGWRRSIDWNPWTVLMVLCAWALLSSVFLWWDKGQLSPGLLVLPLFGALYGGWLKFQKARLSNWAWADLASRHQKHLFFPLMVTGGLFQLWSRPLSAPSTLWLLLWLLALPVLAELLGSKGKWQKMEGIE